MRILLVSSQDYIHHAIPSRHHYIFEQLADRHDVHVAHFHVSRGTTRPTKLTVDNATLFPVGNPALHYLINGPYHFAALRRIVRREKIEVVVSGSILAGAAAIYAAKTSAVPVLFDLKDWFPDSAAAYYGNSAFRELLRRFVLRVVKYNLDNCDVLTTVSPALVQKLGELGYDAKLITNGVNTELFAHLDSQTLQHTRQMLGFNRDEFVLGFVGSVERWYALEEVIRAFAKLARDHPQLRLLIVGSSHFTGYMKHLVGLTLELNVSGKVHFTGALPYEQLPPYIHSMNACLIPLQPRDWVKIALPDKFFEYSACNKPILTTPIPGVMEIGTPNIFVYNDYEEFNKLVIQLMQSRPTYNLNLEEFDWKRIAGQFEQTLSEMLS